MNRPPIELDSFHHIYNRGVDKRIIFNDDHDRRCFILYLQVLNNMDIASPNTFEKLERKAKNLTPSEQLINIVAFYLMPNHFHLLLHERTEGGISKFMHRLSTAYTMFFNQKTGRTGALFEGRFKSKLIDSDAYLLKVIDYIHLNPQKIKPLNLYPWSSYADYCNKNVYEKVLNRDILREFTTVPNDHASWLATQKEISGIDHLTIDDNDR